MARDCSLFEPIEPDFEEVPRRRSDDGNDGETDSLACTQTPDGGNDPEKQLVEAAKLGDCRAFSELSSRYTAVIYRKMFRVVRNREDAEDLVQETLLRAFNHLDQFRGGARFSTWLFRIGINSALDLLRRKRRNPETSFDRRQEDGESWEAIEFPDPAANAEQVYAKRQASCLISLALQRLPQTYQTLVRGYHEEERPLADLARILGISTDAAKARLFRARVTLRAALKKGRLSESGGEQDAEHSGCRRGRRPKSQHLSI